MSRDPMPMDWDDARIAAAFRARFDVEPAPGLMARVLAELTRLPRSRPRFVFARRSTFAFMAVALALVLVLVGVQTGVLPWLPSKSPVPRPSVTARPTSTPEPFPSQVLVKATGATLPVGSVADAITVRDGGVNSQELAIGGWYVFNVVPCPKLTGVTDPLEGCPLDFAWLMTDPEQLATGGAGAGAFRQPSGPAIHPVIGFTGPDLEYLMGAYTDPVHVVFVGHFDDAPLAKDCSAAGHQACLDRFIVDEVPWPSGPIARTTPTTVADLPVESVQDAIAANQGDEIAVAGWYQGTVQPLNCPRSWMVVVFQGCTKPFQFLMQDPETILAPPQSIHPPSGPGFGVTFDGFDSPINPGLFNDPNAPAQPTQVVLIGHFHDRRAQICTADIRTACGQQFMVDAIAWLSGRPITVPQDLTPRNGDVPTLAVAQQQAEQGLAAAHPQYAIVNTVGIGGDHAFELEPGIADDKSVDFSGAILFIHAYDNGTPGIKPPAIFAIDPGGAVFTDDGSGWASASP
jgi:hypothetical protein